MTLEQLKAALKAKLLEMKAVVEPATDPTTKQATREFTAEETAKLKTLSDAATELKRQIAEKESSAAVTDQVTAMLKDLDLGGAIGFEPGKTSRKAGALLTADELHAAGSLGDVFVDSPEFKSWLAMVAPNGEIPAKSRLSMDQPIGFKGALTGMTRGLGAKALITGASDTSAGVFVTTDRTDIFETLGRRPLMIRDAFSKRTTNSDLIEYVSQTARGNNAAFTPEATAATGASGTKPEGSFAFAAAQAAVKTVAEWVPATRRALADAGQLRGIIDQELTDDLAEEEEDQLVSGDGVGENLLGVLNTSGTQAKAFDTDVLTTTRKARTLVRTVGRSTPNAFLMNPSDWEAVDLLQDNNGRFYGDGPFGVTTPRLWGLPVIESEAIPAGTALVGDFSKCVIWDRQQAQIFVSDSHSDFFIRNLIAILAEQREAFAVVRPSAIVVVDLTP